jgi:ATP-dependent DNA helicase RecG
MREDEYTEFKQTTAELNEAMISISSMLNKHRQGRIYFGLKSDGTPYKFTITDSTIRDVSKKIFESIRPQTVPTIGTEVIDGNEVIVVDVHGEDVPYSAFGRYYIRVADEDRELTPGELRKIMIGQEYAENWENRTSNDTIADVDAKTLDNFARTAVKCGRMPDYGSDRRAILSNLGLLNGDGLTNAGKFLFSGSRPVVLKMVVYAADRKERIRDIAREEGNIFQLIDAAVRYFIKKVPEIPVDALREAVVNSFAHARYDIPVRHEIDVFTDRIAIVNPGPFANEFEPADFVHRNLHSYLRNETIAHVLYLCKDTEASGSGIRKIYTLCEQNGVKVRYINQEKAFTLEFSRVDRN